MGLKPREKGNIVCSDQGSLPGYKTRSQYFGDGKIIKFGPTLALVLKQVFNKSHQTNCFAFYEVRFDFNTRTCIKIFRVV